MKDEMKGKMKEVMDVAPWTTLDLSGEKGNEWWVWLCEKILLCVWTDYNIGAEGARALSESLKINTMLTALDLSGERGSNENIGEEGAIMIIEALKTNSTLTLLNIGRDK